jgi:hypothetical protein
MNYHIKLIKIAKNPLAAYYNWMRKRTILKRLEVNLTQTLTKEKQALETRLFELNKTNK